MTNPTNFAVIGAGVAGLQAGALLKQAGFGVTLFEKSGDVGGVWQHNYAGYALQVRKWHYEIPGYAWPASAAHPRYPTGPEVQLYLQSYARDAGLLPSIRFHADVHAVRPTGSGAADGAQEPGSDGWEVVWKDQSGATHEDHFDFVVLATGLFNHPERPEWAAGKVSASPPSAGPWVVYAKDFTDAALTQHGRGKRIVVVGGGKTAHDVALASSRVAVATTLVSRRGHWMAPQIVLGLIPFEFASYTRWAWALQPAWYAASTVNKAAHAVFRPLVSAVWALLGFLFPLHTGHPAKLVPKHGLLEGIYDTIGIVDAPQFAKAFRSGALATAPAHVVGVSAEGSVQLSNGSTLPADIVVLGTGYTATTSSLIPTQLQKSAGYDGSNQWLYRNVLPTSGVHNLAFIGQNATFQHVLTTALQSRWLVDVLTGAIKLPGKEERLADVHAQQAWVRSFGGTRRSNNFVWAQHGKYHDALVRDIRGSTAVYGWNLLGEWFGYIYNQLYAPLFPGNQALTNSLLDNPRSSAPIAVANGTANGVAAVHAKAVSGAPTSNVVVNALG